MRDKREIIDIAWKVRDGTADPDQAKRLMALFRDVVRDGRRLPQELLLHFADAFDAYLTGDRSLIAALGLLGKKGRPKADEAQRIQMAAEVIRRRFAGTSHQVALSEVAEQFRKAESVIGEAFDGYKQSAVIMLRGERPLDSNPWNEEERSILEKILQESNEAVAAMMAGKPPAHRKKRSKKPA